MRRVIWLGDASLADLGALGGKNASLGEMISHLSSLGVTVPMGFATTSDAFREFLLENGIDREIDRALGGLDTNNLAALQAAGASIRAAIVAGTLPPPLEAEVREAFRQLESCNPAGLSVAMRSSATAEDLPEASFAGQQETLLNVEGIDEVLRRLPEVYSSLFTDRAIAYRAHHDVPTLGIALSVGVQVMVRSDIGASGVLFTIDTESGFKDLVLINSVWGLGEAIVQGAVNPDEFRVYKGSLAAGKFAILSHELGTKEQRMVYAGGGEATTRFEPVPVADRRRFSITDDDVHELARMAVTIEAHYGRAMDIEWGKSGVDGRLYILQARPETVESRAEPGGVLRQYRLTEEAEELLSGRAVGRKIGSGITRVLASTAEMGRLQPGDVLVTDMTDPDWEPVIKKASAIVTNRGGRTCHAAIIARELGIPAIVGTGTATAALYDGQPVTVSCAEGETGRVFDGLVDFTVDEVSVSDLPPIGPRLMLNVGSPEQAFSLASLPHHGVGLARLEFIISTRIGIHPAALIAVESGNTAGLTDEVVAEIHQRTDAYGGATAYYVKRLAEGIATIAAAFAPEPVIVRFSDFKSNEYANLLGGRSFEPDEENPMIGYRGASRYVSDAFRASFDLECQAALFVRDTMGLTNLKLMIPFVRTIAEAEGVIRILGENGLERGRNGLEVVMMCEIPANAVLADAFLEHFDGFSIGSNDLTQLTLGLDRDSALVADAFDERDPAVLKLISEAIAAGKRAGKYVGICGQGPSDYPDFARWLAAEGIDSMSLSPDTLVSTWLALAEP
ncbi:phosphoenolpyruvate synthase [Cryobacterium tagatosivorans]|uniref:Phosphoenolpyruvate synthase n=1 Tax=Cryobacterium tagatosivorans TaxID=1259199 RepID=A0A4R8UCG2_9MICO|nr:phosphoenolpyruvate synthase [Cryobacterium tagatosivorans]TFB48987.1 phosphoenolpyruvate synthase [Cryobacterium tagatosivorans]